MAQAPGISLENLVRLGNPAMHPNQLLDFMSHKVNKTQVVLAAMFDLMTSQCDRHAQVSRHMQTTPQRNARERDSYQSKLLNLFNC